MQLRIPSGCVKRQNWKRKAKKQNTNMLKQTRKFILVEPDNIGLLLTKNM